MVDYWQTGASATETQGAAAGAAQPAASGDANMDDEILVSQDLLFSRNDANLLQ